MVIEKKALASAVGFVDNEEIDRINILNASFLAMHRTLDDLQKQFDCFLVDGNRYLTTVESTFIGIALTFWN